MLEIRQLIRCNDENFAAKLNWLQENISPQTYYLHNEIGGSGWGIIMSTAASFPGELRVYIDNEDLKIQFCLKFL